MGLVDYSESDSESEAPHKAPAPKTTTAPGKKPFQKVVDRSNPGKIVINLPQETGSSGTEPVDGPPAKRARTGNAGNSRFSGFNSFLPPPKNANGKPAAVASSGGSSKPRPGVNLQTSAAPGFSRGGEDEIVMEGGDAAPQSGAGMSLPPPKKPAEPSIPEGQKAAEDVKLVGKPMMFKPLSVSRNQKKKKTPKPAPSTSTAPPKDDVRASANGSNHTVATEPPPPPKKVSLFSMHTEEFADSAPTHNQTGAYEPLFETQAQTVGPVQPEEELYAQYAQSVPGDAGQESLNSVADDLHLSAAERRELFGRNGERGLTAKKVINFNMDREYQHNEEVRAAGEQQMHNPVRAIQAAGKNSLKQLVSNAQNQREALEDSFAKGKSIRKEGAGRYGW